ncbi:MAG TPA: RagB/SusD family nutrient uptake outer membrane protein [Parapedobacter sp.]|uniref:RagB/SusD family nutrient uptake outer membrane protein n=1 Tax=Parapedobacter sp. TaxID=1958893 RepID=UPI002BED5757|nr:RagB/SusD family nutrient uptake outer membrane protein [Parapedobacter sp.]HWK56800.1 RagB/SusD family nutrient uptake outer membrane protein [Parapedobacter sp.]
MENKKKSKIFIQLLVLVGLFFGTSCSSMLDPEDDGRVTYEFIFSNQFKIQQLYSSCFSTIVSPNIMSASFTDEAQDADYLTNSSLINWYNGNITAANHGINTFGGDPWNTLYTFIRRCNVFLTYIHDETAGLPADQKAGYIAEVHAMRAYYYWQLAKRYGGVPIVTKPLPVDYDYSSDVRPSFGEVVNFVLSECEEALKGPDTQLGFPWGHHDRLVGRLNRASVYAIMSEAALYAASPLWADGTITWEQATEITGRALAECLEHGYELFKAAPTDGTSYNAYENYFLMQDVTRSVDRETIFWGGGQLSIWSNAGLPTNPGMVTAGQTPTQNLVDAYEMRSSGQPPILGYEDTNRLVPIINPNSGYNPQAPYEGRDPRFYATVQFNGAARYPNRPDDKRIETFVGGAEGIANNDRRHTPTGYYLRKYNHPNSTNAANADGAMRMFRLATLYLNFAEGAYHSHGPDTKIPLQGGREMSAVDAVNAIRDRAGMPHFPAGMTKEAFEDKYRNERRVELAFEGQRPFDLRRWKILAEQEETVTGMRIEKEADGTYIYNRFAFPKRKAIADKFLIFPINITEITKIRENTGANWQNPGWDF